MNCVIRRQSQIHCSSNEKITTAELYLWLQDMHYFSVFPIGSEQHVMLFLWIGSQNDRVFLFESGYSSTGDDTVGIER